MSGGIGVFCVVAGVIGLERLNSVAALFRPFFSVGACLPEDSTVVGVPTVDRFPTAFAIASRVRAIAPVVGVGSGGTGVVEGGGGGGLPIRIVLTFSETILGVSCFLNTLRRLSFNARSGLKKLGEA